MRKILLITYILVLALTMQGKNENPVRSALVSQGDSCMAEHDSQHAIGFYQQHLNTHPGDLPVLRKLASCYRMRGDNKESHRLYGQHTQRQPQPRGHENALLY